MGTSKAFFNFIIRSISAIFLWVLVVYVWNLGRVFQEGLACVLFLLIFLEWFFLWSKVKIFKQGIITSTLVFLLGTAYLISAEFGFWHMLHHAKYYALIPGIMIVLWTVDSGAYIIGSLLKGPKLAPSISSGKTWSGFIGGAVLGVAVGYYFFYSSPVFYYDKNSAFILTLGLPILGQLGDLLESKVKRILNVKDSSSLIPGHGGILDRLDSALIVFFSWEMYRIFS